MEHTNLILNLSREGVRPSKIAATEKIPIVDVTQALINAIKARQIKRSQVLATLNNKEWQEDIARWKSVLGNKLNSSDSRVDKHIIKIVYETIKDGSLSDFDLTIEEFNLYFLCYEKSFEDGELYELVCEIERILHTKIKAMLRQEYGDLWWKQGVPLNVREECAKRSESDPEFFGFPAYDYTTLGELKIILHRNWKHFKSHLPLAGNGKELEVEITMKSLDRLTKIRNKVMHPIGAIPPNEEDFFFVREMQEKFDLAKWR